MTEMLSTPSSTFPEAIQGIFSTIVGLVSWVIQKIVAEKLEIQNNYGICCSRQAPAGGFRRALWGTARAEATALLKPRCATYQHRFHFQRVSLQNPPNELKKNVKVDMEPFEPLPKRCGRERCTHLATIRRHFDGLELPTAFQTALVHHRPIKHLSCCI